jgi:tetratricopeptide (TPR) repeat protein
MDSSPQIQRASLLLEQGRVNDAIRELKTLLQLEPENAQALCLYGRCFFKKKDYEQGMEMIRSALRIHPLSSYCFYLLGFGYYRMDMHAAALENLERAISLSPHSAEYYGMSAHVLIAEKQFQQALDKANEGLALDAESINCLNARSIALNKLKRTDAAIQTMQDALAKDPENEMTHLTIGWNLLEKGDHNQAAVHFREALRINPDNENARIGLKEALKSRIPPYKWLLSYSFWVNNRGKKARRIAPVVTFLLFRLVIAVMRSNEYTAAAGGIIVGIYLLFVISSWIINPLANFFLLFHRDGKYALDLTEKRTAVSVVVSLVLGLVLCTLGFLVAESAFRNGLWLSGAACLAMAIPLGHLVYPLAWSGHGSLNKISLVLVTLGLLTFCLAFIYLPLGLLTGGIFLVLFVLNSWFRVFRD